MRTTRACESRTCESMKDFDTVVITEIRSKTVFSFISCFLYTVHRISHNSQRNMQETTARLMPATLNGMRSKQHWSLHWTLQQKRVIEIYKATEKLDRNPRRPSSPLCSNTDDLTLVKMCLGRAKANQSTMGRAIHLQ